MQSYVFKTSPLAVNGKPVMESDQRVRVELNVYLRPMISVRWNSNNPSERVGLVQIVQHHSNTIQLSRAVPSIALNTHKHYIKTLLIVCLSCIKIILIHRRIFLNEIIKSYNYPLIDYKLNKICMK
jgi:hypothetical protein